MESDLEVKLKWSSLSYQRDLICLAIHDHEKIKAYGYQKYIWDKVFKNGTSEICGR